MGYQPRGHVASVDIYALTGQHLSIDEKSGWHA